MVKNAHMPAAVTAARRSHSGGCAGAVAGGRVVEDMPSDAAVAERDIFDSLDGLI
jgi:hypothetical protein